MTLRPLLLPILWLALAAPALADKVPLSVLSSYINGLRTAEAEFTQINADGTTSSGMVYIKRPGRVRFEYALPEKTLVIAAGGQVAIFDGKSNQGPEQYPLKRTPLNLILANNVDLATAEMVIGHDGDDDITVITAQDPKHPDYGTIQLVFEAKPLALRQWVITDQAGYQTIVTLGDMTFGAKYPQSFFNIALEAQNRRRP